MLIAVICIILSIIIAVVLWPKVTTMYGKCTIVGAIILVIAISGQYIKLTQKGFLEGFEVQMPELDSPEYSGDNAYIDKEEEAAVNGLPLTNRPKINTLADLDSMAKAGARKPETPAKAEKFNNIVQRETGSDESSIFNPQIIFVNKSSNKADIGFSSSSANVSSSTNVSGAIDEYLKPREDIFSTNEKSGGANPYDWMKEFLKLDTSSSGNGQQVTCPVSKPYADENHGRVNMATLTNKTFVPGMAYTPPTNWYNADIYDRSCRRVCSGSLPDTRLLPIGIMDHGTPIFALEIGGDGTIAKTEEEVQYTNVGSILPKFEYREYVDCGPTPETTAYVPVSTSAATTTTKPVTTAYVPVSGSTVTTGAATTTTQGATTTTGSSTTTTRGATTTTQGATTTTQGATTTTQGATTTTRGATTTTGSTTTTTKV